ncbi:MAG: type II toxin-antitoxin system HicA family toxin [bacterium]|nr:type II toxin-antitoxin system HicA family toxin [bacterium]
MSPRLPSLNARQIIKILRNHGFVLARQSGSYAIFRHSDGRRTTIPVHGKKDIGRGLLRQIMRDTEISLDDLLK